MNNYDLAILGGTVVDGTGRPRFRADVGIRKGRIAHIGKIERQEATEVIDAKGLIVAPGVIDSHTHYDAQLHWDPYCTPSGWNGSTTVLIANCGFGFAPVRKDAHERYMRMMENTEQLSYSAMNAAMPWGQWETFPEWMNILRNMPKGVNVATYLPLNALISYVIGPDEAKKRRATPEERKRMKELLNEAMDAGACGFALSFLGGEGNSHVDYDRSPMPTDIMNPEDAYELADVLRERGEGMIQISCELPGFQRRDVSEELARRSGRPVLHGALMIIDNDPSMHRDTLAWIDDARARGLNILSQGSNKRNWFEFAAVDYNGWDNIPFFRELSAATSVSAKMALVSDPAYRARAREQYDPVEYRRMTAADLEGYILHAMPKSKRLGQYAGQKVGQIAAAIGASALDTFFEILLDSEFTADFRVEEVGGHNPEYHSEILNNPAVLPGISDGGAHNKFMSGGHWSTEVIIWLTRENPLLTLEQAHYYMSGKAFKALGFIDRGTIEPGMAADFMIYDYEDLNFTRNRYQIVKDMPGGEWRRVTDIRGMRAIVVNGVITYREGKFTGATPGKVISNTRQSAAA
jgi:N-acyl-D-amino-acid deacylase